MSKYVLKPVDPTPVDAVQIGGATTMFGPDAQANDWIIKGADGTFSTLPDAEFNDKYMAAPEEPAPESLGDPAVIEQIPGQPEQIA